MVDIWLLLQLYLKKIDAELLFTDTDSLTYEDFFEHKHLLDFSNYSKNSKLLDEINKKVIGKMKDEFGRVTVELL